MRFFIPRGPYCYRYPLFPKANQYKIPQIKACIWWSYNPNKPYQNNGYCHYLEYGDWEDVGFGLLWDKCKECGVKFER